MSTYSRTFWTVSSYEFNPADFISTVNVTQGKINDELKTYNKLLFLKLLDILFLNDAIIIMGRTLKFKLYKISC